MTINNTLAQSIIDADYSTMNYSQLLALSNSITRAQSMISSNMEKKRKEEMAKIKEGYLVAMKSYGATIEEITEFGDLELDNEFDFSTNNEVEEPVISVSSSEDVEDTTCEVEVDTTLALPAHSPEDTEEKRRIKRIQSLSRKHQVFKMMIKQKRPKASLTVRRSNNLTNQIKRPYHQ